MNKNHFLTVCMLLLAALFVGCHDDDDFLMDAPDTNGQPQVSTYASVLTSSLVKEGDYWRATKRVPLVGKGRVVDDLTNNLVALLNKDIHVGHLVDEDLTNSISTAGLLNAEVLVNQIVSIRDLHYIYAPNQKVGFVFKLTNFSTLDLKVLNSLCITTYLKGELQESFGNKEGTGVLELDLISVANNDELKELSFMATKPFDEVQLNMAGIGVSALGNNLSIYYAFVGENEMKTATAESTWFPEAHLHKGFSWTNILNSEHIVDNDLTNYAYYGTLSGLLGDPHATVDFGREIPAGSEVGFVISNVDVLNIDVLGSIILATYDEKNEEMDRATITKAVGLSVVKVGNHSRVSMKTTKPCRQVYINFAGLELKLGGTNVYYAYACDPVTVDITSRFAFSKDTIRTNSYTLPVVPGGKITWEIVSAPPGSLPEIKEVTNKETGYTSIKLIGMIANGDYHLSGIFIPNGSPEGGKEKIPLELVVTRLAEEGKIEGFHVLDEDAGAHLGNIKNGGSLISINNGTDGPNLVDTDRENYAKLFEGLGIGSDVGIVAIDLDKPVTPQKPIRVGFTIQTSFDFIKANVLEFYQIRLFRNGTEKQRGIVNDSEVGSVGLIGSKGNKIRMSIKTTIEFDRIELWRVGALHLSIKEWRLYNAFWEDAENKLGDLNEACLDKLTNTTGLIIDYDKSFTDGLLEVGGTYENLGNLLDNNSENYAYYRGTGAGKSLRLAVKFPPLPRGSSVGFILSKINVANIKIFDHVKLQVYSNGTEVGQNITADFLRAGVLGHEERTIVEVRTNEISTSEFDELVLTISADLLDLLDFTKIYSCFTRRDTDRDGIPDGSEDEENPPTPVIPITAEMVTKHVCLGNPLHVKISPAPSATPKAENETTTYTVVCTNRSKDNEKTSFTGSISKTDGGVIELPNLAVGQYYINIYDQQGKPAYGSALKAWVHPRETTWKGTRDTDWNNWDNWTEGAPWTCTNVTLPNGCVRYPELKQLPAANDLDSLMNYCKYLHIESRAELLNTHLFNQYQYVWMEMTLKSGQNYILSSPLTNTVTGDYFIPAKWQGNHALENKFVRLTSTNSPENRFAPRLYQRCWSREVPGKVITDGVLGTTVITNETSWTAPFNAVAEPITPGMGWMVRAEDEGLPTKDLTFRFPKTHGEYRYFDATGGHLGSAEGVYRDKTTMGRFVVPQGDGTLKVTVSNYKEGTTFVAGNPFAAHLDIAKFLKGNADKISEVKIINNNTTQTVLYRNGEITATSPGLTHLAPMQGFYVTAKNATKNLELTFKADMQVQGNQILMPTTIQPGTLRIMAVNGNRSTQCLVRLKPDSHQSFRKGEDSRMLYDRENPPTVAVFTVADGVATDIQQVPASQKRSIDLGWRMQHSGDVTLQLSHEPGSEWSNWMIENRQTGQRISLSNPETVVKLGKQTTRVGGWRLVKK